MHGNELFLRPSQGQAGNDYAPHGNVDNPANRIEDIHGMADLSLSMQA